MYVYYKYAPYISKLSVLYYVDECVYCYKYEELVKWFVDTLENRFHVKFLGYSNWFMSISILHLKDNYISLYQARYAKFVVAKYLDTATIK